uniref:COesterase domain-containing protein n=1 Tax=Heterorhabditis bacteriophora TaxID=37862 RepID=A0A1I7X2G6_HETBA
MRPFFLGIFLWSFTVAEPIIETKYGKIRGFEYETKSGHIAEIYLGIPYATPPIGDLRFEKPQPPSIWEDVKNCTKFGPTCLPHSKKAILSPAPSEDCLTLNVISPKEKNTTTGHPILVWIHGGGYEIGSTSIYGYKDFADIYIPNDIIVVTVQYRLGVYGFFSTGDSEIPGNYGLFDQTAALKFINQNIVNFGVICDLRPRTMFILLFSYNLIDLEYHNLISGSIEMSGSPWASWALGYNVPQHSKDLAQIILQALECHNEIKKCMKERTVDEIFAAVQRIVSSPIKLRVIFIVEKFVSNLQGEATKDLNPIKFGPVIDEDFILKHPMEMVNEVAPKPALIGLGNKESTFFTILALYPCIHSFGLTKEEFKSWNRQKLIEKLKVSFSERLKGSDYSMVKSAAFWTKMRKYGYDVPSLLKVAVSNEKEEL